MRQPAAAVAAVAAPDRTGEMNRHDIYYVSPRNVRGDHVIFTDDEVHHLSHVKRHKKGDQVWAVDGEGGAYEIELTDISVTRALGKIKQTRRRVGESLSELTLAQAMIKGDRFDWVIEKCVEIGVHRIIPLITENTIVKGGSGKQTRWTRIALGAMKQSGRSVLTEICEPREFKKALSMGTECGTRLIAHAGPDSQPIRIGHPDKRSKGIALVGPEGGFTEEEIGLAADHGFIQVSLGPRRLRAETAGIVISTIILSAWGELC
jgi:16S rRNA (uracil1498-N3)-methyltransferase